MLLSVTFIFLSKHILYGHRLCLCKVFGRIIYVSAIQTDTKNRNNMNKKDPKLTVLQFNECINNQDSDGLENFLTQDTKMIAGEEITHVGKDTLKKVWIQFFKMCPDYKTISSESNHKKI